MEKWRKIIHSHRVTPLCLLYLFRPGRVAEYCDQPVCLCVCLSVCLSIREHISGTAGPIFTKFCVRIPRGRGSVLLRRRCATLCTSGYMDDVTFGPNGRDAGKGLHSAAAINYRTCATGAESDVLFTAVNRMNEFETIPHPIIGHLVCAVHALNIHQC